MLSVTVTLFPGRLTEGVLLAMNQECMRLALKGAEDIIELRRIDGQWRTEDNHTVEFEVLLSDGTAELEYCQEARPRAMAAGCA